MGKLHADLGILSGEHHYGQQNGHHDESNNHGSGGGCPLHLEPFEIGTDDGGVSFGIYEWIDDQGDQVICSTRPEDYASFITASLNLCSQFPPCRALPEISTY
jgi:hypothetical protein